MRETVEFIYILLDADNMLMDFNAAEQYALEATLQFYGFPYNEEIHRAYDKINAELWEQFNHGEIKKEYLLTERFRRFYKEMNWNSKEGYVRTNQRYLKNLSDCSILLDGALDFCREMSRECELYIITNGVASSQRKRFSKSEIRPYIRDIFISEEIGYQKPEQEFFSFVFQKIPSFKKEKAIIIGDTLSSDIEGANRAGVKSCWFNPKNLENNTKVICDFIVSDFSQIKEVIKGK